MKKSDILIKNRKAFFNYQITDKYIAGIMLLGTEIKSIRESAVNLSNSFCSIENDNIIVKGEINLNERIIISTLNSGYEGMQLTPMMLEKNEKE